MCKSEPRYKISHFVQLMLVGAMVLWQPSSRAVVSSPHPLQPLIQWQASHRCSVINDLIKKRLVENKATRNLIT